jgi:hypothetical protein
MQVSDRDENMFNHYVVALYDLVCMIAKPGTFDDKGAAFPPYITF